MALKRAIQEFFDAHNYLEVDTPTVVTCPGVERYLEYFETHWVDYRNERYSMWLRSSPELHMKQVLASGIKKIYQIGPCFRNKGELSSWHQPEFTLLEWYQSDLSYEEFMEQTTELLHFTLRRFPKSPLKLPKKFDKISIKEAFFRYLGIDLKDSDQELGYKAKVAGVISVNEDDPFETAYYKCLLEKIEPELASYPAIIVYDYPCSQASLAIIQEQVAKRFEVYINGVELSNGFLELLNPEENESRIKSVNSQRLQDGLSTTNEDRHFYAALKSGIEPCCGNALGFDRWLSLLQGATNLDASIPFRSQWPNSAIV